MTTENTMKSCPWDVGDILWTSNAADPSTRWPGTEWVQIKDVFVLAAGDEYPIGNSGGEAEHTLTLDEMPSHDHGYRFGVRSTGYIDDTYNGFQLSQATIDSENINFSIYTNGGNQPHNNMPPYVTRYCWERTA